MTFRAGGHAARGRSPRADASAQEDLAHRNTVLLEPSFEEPLIDTAESSADNHFTSQSDAEPFLDLDTPFNQDLLDGVRLFEASHEPQPTHHNERSAQTMFLGDFASSSGPRKTPAPSTGRGRQSPDEYVDTERPRSRSFFVESPVAAVHQNRSTRPRSRRHVDASCMSLSGRSGSLPETSTGGSVSLPVSSLAGTQVISNPSVPFDSLLTLSPSLHQALGRRRGELTTALVSRTPRNLAVQPLPIADVLEALGTVQGNENRNEADLDPNSRFVFASPAKSSSDQAAISKTNQNVIQLDVLCHDLDLPPAIHDLFVRLVLTPQPAAVFITLLYPSTTESDVWPDIRETGRVPAKYTPLPAGSEAVQFLEECRDLRNKRHRRDEDERDGSEEPYWEAHAIRWPMNVLPTEMYFAIMDHLSRDDIKALRLVCQEFEEVASKRLFENVVVPFNAEIYGMLQNKEYTPAAPRLNVDVKGKGKAPLINEQAAKNRNSDDTYQGYGKSVFNQFGKHLKKFGMSFEIDEQALGNPPVKGNREAHTSYWGEYEWPYHEYRRFAEVAGLENTADETFRMKTAFSFFKDVKELAVSVDCGLGWLHGPDMSVKSSLIRQKPPVFGTKRAVPDRQLEAQQAVWRHVKHSFSRSGPEAAVAALNHTDPRHAILSATKCANLTRSDFELLSQMYRRILGGKTINFPFIDQICIPNDASLQDNGRSSTVGVGLPSKRKASSHFSQDATKRFFVGFKDVGVSSDADLFEGNLTSQELIPRTPQSCSEPIILFVKQEQGNEAQKYGEYPVRPNDLTNVQKEWLLEMEWAQRAFLSSYMLAIYDNRTTAFRNVESLNFARISSRYLTAFLRDDFWSALPSLAKMKIHVIPDWRDIRKDAAGYVVLSEVHPSRSQIYFWQLLTDHIARLKNLRALDIGWWGGGEHETGLCGRNAHLMPAPIMHADISLANIGYQETINNVLRMPQIEHLTLTNCWITPAILVSFVNCHKDKTLKKLTLNSVSLTTVLSSHPGNAVNGTIMLQNQAQAQLFTQHLAMAVQNGTVNQATINQGVPVAHPIPPLPAAFQNVPNATQLWVQWHQAVQGLHNAQAVNNQPNVGGLNMPGNAIVNPTLNPNLTVNANTNANHDSDPAPAAPKTWLGPHRNGSWPWVLDVISPGDTLEQFGGTSPANIMSNTTTIETIELVSCGYARLPSSRSDQSVLDPPVAYRKTPQLTKREESLRQVMLKDPIDPMLADIVQHIAPIEEQALKNAWAANIGWEDPDAREDVELDGWLPGGTGRFSACIHKTLRSESYDGDEMARPGPA